MKTCAALNGAVESTVPDRRAVPEPAPCCAALPLAAKPLPAKNPYAIARVIIDRMTSLDDAAIFPVLMIVLLNLIQSRRAMVSEERTIREKFSGDAVPLLNQGCHPRTG